LHSLLSTAELHALQQSSECVIFDCRFVLDDPDAGFEDYLESHIPGAVYAHLDKDLSSPPSSGSGRHPLPGADQFALFLSRSGWQPGTLLVAYDDAGGAIAARLWWLMKYFAHDNAALLDGGIPAWWAAGLELEHGQSEITPQPVTNLEGNDSLVLSAAEVISSLDREGIVLADARAPERFTGKIEPIDRVAGHIPGSVNYPYNLNLNADGTFRPVGEIRHDLQAPDITKQKILCICAALASLPATTCLLRSWLD